MNNKKFTIEPISIEVEINNPNICLETWVTSRNQFLEIDYDKNEVLNKKTGDKWSIEDYKKQVFEMDLGMAYFQFAKFSIKSSIILRELFYTFLEKARWANTQRYSTVSSMVCSAEAYEPGVTEAAFDKFIEMTNAYNEGKTSQFDNVREYMPLAYKTSWQIGMPIKQFVKYCALVYIHFHDTFPQLWQGLWTACIKNPILEPWMKNVLKYSVCEEVNMYNLKDNSVFTDEQIDACFKDYGNVGMVLYSQLIRHESTHCLGYIEFLKNLPKDQLHNCKLYFPIKVRQSKQRELEMLRTRTSYFAVTDGDWKTATNTWGAVLRNYIPEGAQIEDYKHMFKFFDSDGNIIPEVVNKYHIDDSLRLHKGYNTYTPDALSLEYKDLIYQRAERYGWNPLLRLYEQLFDKGYIKDNPNNPDRIKWDKLVEESKRE